MLPVHVPNCSRGCGRGFEISEGFFACLENEWDAFRFLPGWRFASSLLELHFSKVCLRCQARWFLFLVVPGATTRFCFFLVPIGFVLSRRFRFKDPFVNQTPC